MSHVLHYLYPLRLLARRQGAGALGLRTACAYNFRMQVVITNTQMTVRVHPQNRSPTAPHFTTIEMRAQTRTATYYPKQECTSVLKQLGHGPPSICARSRKLSRWSAKNRPARRAKSRIVATVSALKGSQRRTHLAAFVAWELAIISCTPLSNPVNLKHTYFGHSTRAVYIIK